jgi:NifU-like protein involved in Fe-S cluster formation
MDEVTTKRYRQLLQAGFEYTGSLENPSIFLNSRLEGLSICSQAARDYMHIYLNVVDSIITDVKYMCFCNPIANVVVEALCALVKGKTIEEAKLIVKEDFLRAIGSNDEVLSKKVAEMLELLNRGIRHYIERELPV